MLLIGQYSTVHMTIYEQSPSCVGALVDVAHVPSPVGALVDVAHAPPRVGALMDVAHALPRVGALVVVAHAPPRVGALVALYFLGGVEANAHTSTRSCPILLVA